jgi:hypothetical protein
MRTWKMYMLIGPPSHYLMKDQRRSGSSEEEKKKGFMEGPTKKMSQNLVLDTDAPEHQPFKLSQNLHQANFVNLRAAGLRQQFQNRKEKQHMFGKMQED